LGNLERTRRGSEETVGDRGMIVVRTSVIELGLYSDEYEAFIDALRAEGFEARIEEPEEYRSVGQIAGAVGIYLAGLGADAVRGAAIDAIRRAAAMTISRAKRGRRSQPLRQLPVFAPNGQDVLLWVPLPDEPENGRGD
jgi:hypothetical protein